MRNYRASRTSISPMIHLTRSGEKSLEQLGHLEARFIEGQKLVVLEAATLFMRTLKRAAPLIDGVKYADDLKAVFMVGQSGEVTFSIIGEGRDRPTVSGVNEIGYLYTKGTLTPAAQKWYEVLRRYQPWPVTMYPMPTGPSEPVGLTVRRVSKSAVSEAAIRISNKKTEIERSMASVGAPVEIAESSDSKIVQTDLAFAILQIEYGLGRKSDAHWRPTIQALKGEVGGLQGKFKSFMSTGNKAIFDIDNDIKEVSNIRELGSDLQEKLARSTGLKADRL